MPYVISPTTDGSRVFGYKATVDFSKAFFQPLARGEKLTPELLALTPDPYYVEGPSENGMPEFFGGNRRVWTIKDSARQIIEALEPGVHTFIPVNVRVRGSKRGFGQYYLLYPGQAIDAVVIDETDFTNGRGRAGFEAAPTGVKLPPVLSSFGDTVLSGGLIKGRHLWRGGWGRFGQKPDPFWPVLFCSDELADRIRAAGMEGWEFRRCKVQQTH